MPELPEVETIKRSLAPRLAGRTVRGVVVYNPRVIARPEAEEFCRRLRGAAFGAPARRGKYLLLPLNTGWALVVHLRMTGRLTWQPGPVAPAKHTHVIWELDDGFLVYEDLRRFGRLWLVKETELGEIKGLAGLGPEPLGEGLTAEWLAGRLAGQRRPLKNLLLDQTFVAGIGNIYADEILHRAGLHPLRRANTLDEAEAAALWAAIRGVLAEGLAHGGTTIRDYVDGEGESGRHQDFLQVYGRAGEKCPRCGGTVTRIKVAGRSTYFCPVCQS